jgi:drug/metabolite transporter (DMT)-like permease
MDLRLHNAKIQMLKLSAVALACIGVLLVVYGGQSTSSNSAPTSQSTSTSPNTTSGGSALIGDLLTLISSLASAAYQVLYRRFVSLPSDPDESISAPIPPHSPVSSTQAGYEPLLTDDNASLLSSRSSRTYPPSADDGSTLPFGLYPNLLTSAIGVATLVSLWPMLVILHWTGVERFTLPVDGKTWASVAVIMLAGITFNSGYMVSHVVSPFSAY